MVTAAMLVALTWLMVIPPAAAKSRHRGHTAVSTETSAKPQDSLTASKVPLPEPRPAEAPQSRKAADGKGAPADSGKASEPVKGETGKDEAAAPAGPPPPSACRLALTDEFAVAPSIPAIHGPGACGGDDLVRLEAVVLPDKRRVALTPAATMRCTMATAVVNWVRSDVAPEVAKLGSEITALDNFDSYECRGRNGVTGAPLSEHGRANAIDVHGFKLADGRMIELTDRTQPRDFRETVLHSLCTRFPTVLGPDSDWHHEDHIHIDLIERRSNYRICQWDVLDPMPKVAPLLPEARPGDAPPREIVAAEEGDKKGQSELKASGPSAKDLETTPGKAAAHPAGPDDANKPQAAPSGKAAAEKAAQGDPVKDNGATDKLPPDKATTDKVPSEPAPAAKSAARSSPETTATDKRSPDKPSTDKASSDKTSTDKASTDRPSTDKASTDKAATDKPSVDKAAKNDTVSKTAARAAAHQPAPRKRRHIRRDWNPFSAFF
jgi:hypothetical protein